MSAKPEHYDVIRKPVITEKATMASEANAVVFEVAHGRRQAADQGGGRGAFGVKVKAVNTDHHQGQGQAVPRRQRAAARTSRRPT